MSRAKKKPIAKERGTVSWHELTRLLLEAGDVAPYATREALKRVIAEAQ